MRHIIFALALLCPAAALAQGTTPATTPPAAADEPAGAQPMVGDKPLVQVGKKSAGKKGEKVGEVVELIKRLSPLRGEPS